MLPVSLSERLDFMKLGADSQKYIQSIKPVIMSELPNALDGFYEQIRVFPQTNKFFSGAGQIAGAKSKQLAHWDIISSGRFDQNYAQAVTTIGEVHARIGLEPRWYIGGYALVLEVLIGKILEVRWPKARFGAKRHEAKQVSAELGAVIKAMLLDMDFAISVYLEAAEEMRKKGEKEVLAKERKTVVDSLGAAMAAMSRCDLTYRMANDIPEEYSQLRVDFDAAMARLQETMVAISAATGSLRTGTDEIASASDDLSRRTEQQAASLEETAAALDGITVTVRKTAEGSRHARAVVGTARDNAEDSGRVVRMAVEAMDSIARSSREIGQIIGVIDEIAFQTNLLALNAGVEAARAGEAGRGFAVVASEVRALAQRSADAAKEIKRLISSSGQQVEEGVALVGKTGEALSRIVAQVTEIDGVVSEIAASAQEQATALDEVNVAVNQMDQVTQQNASMVEEATVASRALANETSELTRLIGQFQIEDASKPRRRSDPSRPAKALHSPSAPVRALRVVGRGGAVRKEEAANQEWAEF